MTRHNNNIKPVPAISEFEAGQSSNFGEKVLGKRLSGCNEAKCYDHEVATSIEDIKPESINIFSSSKGFVA